MEETNEEKEQVGEGEEKVGDTRGPVCSAVLRDFPKGRVPKKTGKLSAFCG